MNANTPSIILSSHDVSRLERLLESAAPQFRDTVEALEEELARAEVRAPAD
ncbi:MAG TPA: nucleoside diphosphate kinase regulator, partial [Gammaproteobacteria bacterium]|nr:nucleoside diphosphate kinase regulator [Gammaproteobacteria bacterium]MCH77324.1 nucleoside diphosphate kinase regulator [Gammaproteobacteria bacterium]